MDVSGAAPFVRSGRTPIGWGEISPSLPVLLNRVAPVVGAPRVKQTDTECGCGGRTGLVVVMALIRGRVQMSGLISRSSGTSANWDLSDRLGL